MWDAVGKILSGSNGVAIALLIVLVIGLVVICARQGLVRIQTDRLTVGRDAGETERAILRNQIEWTKLSTQAYEKQIPRPEGYDEYLGRYISELVFDEIVNWIVFNHIEDTRTYIGIKQEIIWNIVQAHVKRPDMRSDEFRRWLDEYVLHVVKNLVAIRGEYKKR